MQVITSKDNEFIKEIKKLKEKKFRDKANKYIVEGIKLVREAIDENQKVHYIIICEDCVNDGTIDQKTLYEVAKFECIYVTEKVFFTITDVSNPQGLLAIVEKNNHRKNIDYNEDIIIILDGIQDPGNLGTILRTIDSANLKQVIVSKETADSYNPKVVRSTMGAIFRVNIIESDDLLKSVKEISENGFEIVCTSLDTDKSPYDIKFYKKAIIIGNEANGVSKDLQNNSDIKVKIPMLGKTESLNASVAAGIMIYEYVREKVK